MHAQQHRRRRRQRPFEIVQVRAIGRSDFAQDRAGARQYVGNAQAAADLDELSARHDRFASLCERVEDQQQGGRAVVHHERVGRARERAQRRSNSIVARTARPAARSYSRFEYPRGDRLDG